MYLQGEKEEVVRKRQLCVCVWKECLTREALKLEQLCRAYQTTQIWGPQLQSQSLSQGKEQDA
ncbi:MAG: hypothetical protein A6F71_10265 [Cycloclasticus sp. symbiont of Poecilosclerida sp. M]|nr:MAG: hypothetical protein A6F71_10265 [Cycloclasticus sp. symbiont of Poecilosclerida sp. M]